MINICLSAYVFSQAIKIPMSMGKKIWEIPLTKLWFKKNLIFKFGLCFLNNLKFITIFCIFSSKITSFQKQYLKKKIYEIFKANEYGN